jgi:hypothetical protein
MLLASSASVYVVPLVTSSCLSSVNLDVACVPYCCRWRLWWHKKKSGLVVVLSRLVLSRLVVRIGASGTAVGKARGRLRRISAA